jgi:hypothetical protein
MPQEEWSVVPALFAWLGGEKRFGILERRPVFAINLK